MAIEIVDFPIKNGDFPWQNVSSPDGKWSTSYMGLDLKMLGELIPNDS